MAPDNIASDGIYFGWFIVPVNLDLYNGAVTGNFTDRAGNRAAAVTSSDLLNINSPSLPTTMTGYLTPNNRWNWTTGGSGNAATSTTDLVVESGQDGYAFLDGLDTSGPIAIFDWSPDAAAPKAVFIPNVDSTVAAATVVATFDSRPMLFDIPKGSTLNNSDIAGERRVFFGTWGYDSDATDTFDSYLTDNFKTIMSNILGELAPSDPSYNPAPNVKAGSDVSIYLDESVQLAGEVSDVGSEDGSSVGGVDSSYWTLESGPGTATFVPADTTNVLDPIVSFSAMGTYDIMLQATDGEKDANDIVTIVVKDHAAEFLVGHWDFEGDALDKSDNSNDGEIYTLGEGGFFDTNAAVGTNSINLVTTTYEHAYHTGM